MKKQLLNESEIRKMMKFANIGTLTNGFVDRLNEAFESEPEEDEDLEAGPPGEDMEPELGADDELGDVEDDDAGLEGEEDGAPDEAVAGVRKAVEGLQDALRAAGRDDLADLISVEEEGAEEPMDMDMEEPMEMGMEEPMDMDMEEPAEMGAEEEEPMMEEMDVVDDEELEEATLNEVARRVARRLSAMRR